MGMAIGAALTGLRPVVEFQYADFLFCAMDQIVNQAAKIRLMSGGQARVPLVIRAPQGAMGGEPSIRRALRVVRPHSRP